MFERKTYRNSPLGMNAHTHTQPRFAISNVALPFGQRTTGSKSIRMNEHLLRVDGWNRIASMIVKTSKRNKKKIPSLHVFFFILCLLSYAYTPSTFWIETIASTSNDSIILGMFMSFYLNSLVQRWMQRLIVHCSLFLSFSSCMN